MSKFPETDDKPILIHAGFPKCLSSWLQKKVFKPEFGYLKVMNPVDVQINIIDPAPFSFSAAQSQDLIKETIQQNNHDLVPVITSEALSGNMYSGGYNGKELIDRVYSIAPNGKVLFLIREQRALIRSLYKSLVVWGMPQPIDRLLKPIQPRLTPQFNIDFFRFDLRIRYYREIFGEENVKVLAYEQFLETPHKFLREIHNFSANSLRFEDIVPKIPVKHRVNSGQTLLNIEIERLKNRFFVSGPFNYNALIDDNDERWLKRVDRSKKNRLPRILDNCLEDRFKNKVLKATQGEFKTSNQELMQLTGLDLEKYGYEL